MLDSMNGEGYGPVVTVLEMYIMLRLSTPFIRGETSFALYKL